MKVIETARTSATPAIVDTLASAFQDDPAFRWIIPDPAKRAKALPRFFRTIVPLDFANGIALTSPSSEVATLWRAPGRSHSGTLETLRAGLPLLAALGTSIGRGLAVGNLIDAHHPKDFDFYYLHYAGVRPEYQGKGWGGAAIREGIARAEAEGKPVYLETATASNVGLYQRLGFTVRAEWDVPKGGPHFWSMLRR